MHYIALLFDLPFERTGREHARGSLAGEERQAGHQPAFVCRELAVDAPDEKSFLAHAGPKNTRRSRCPLCQGRSARGQRTACSSIQEVIAFVVGRPTLPLSMSHSRNSRRSSTR